MTSDRMETILYRWLAPLGRDLPVIYAVGGAVRDHLLGRLPRDVDIVCADAAGLARRTAAAQDPPAALVDLSRQRYTPCFRVIHRDRRDDCIDILNMNGPAIEDDLRQRDFTINAMARRVGPGGQMGDLIDPLNGREDLRSGHIRTVSPRSLPDDPLRLLRGVRLAAELELAIPPDTRRAMTENAARLSQSAGERIQAELLAIFRNPASSPLIRLLDDVGALSVIFPEIPAMKNCSQNAYHHLDVWGHCLETLARLEELLNRPETLFGQNASAVMGFLNNGQRLALLKLAALLHDLAKPATRRFLPDKQRTTFYGHARAGRAMVALAADRLRLSQNEKAFLTTLVGQHMRPLALARPETRPSTIIKWFGTNGDVCLAIIMLAAADLAAKAGEKISPAYRDRFRRWAERTAADYRNSLKHTLAAASLVSGHDLLALGMPPGPALGKLLATLRKEQDQGRLTSRAEALVRAEELLARDKRQQRTINKKKPPSA
ncbi:MAG: HD domain-containing protein [Desulfosudaceae bacterium]